MGRRHGRATNSSSFSGLLHGTTAAMVAMEEPVGEHQQQILQGILLLFLPGGGGMALVRASRSNVVALNRGMGGVLLRSGRTMFSRRDGEAAVSGDLILQEKDHTQEKDYPRNWI